MNSLGSLSFWDTLRSFLHLDVLFITEETHVVDDLEAVSGLALGAFIGFLDFACDNIDLLGSTAFLTLEAGFFHFRDDI